MGNHYDEMVADFQEFYSLDATLIGKDINCLRAAILCMQLPLGSRVMREYNSSATWDSQTALLARIEYDFRLWMYANADKKRRGKPPEPIKPPQNKKELETEKQKRLQVEGGQTIHPVDTDRLKEIFGH